MWISVDTSVCCGHGRCAIAAPEIYQLDENGYCGIESLELRPGQEAAARVGALVCPEQAISVTDVRAGEHTTTAP